MIKKIIFKINLFYKNLSNKKELMKILEKCKSENNIFLIGSPLHGNIGDHAISIAEIEILKKTNKNIVEIPGEYFKNFSRLVIPHVHRKDIIVITGGGFLGTLWLNEEKLIRSIIKKIPNNKIIIMPQTMFYENSEIGKKELQKAKKIYEKHYNLSIILRDKRSYEFCKTNFKSSVKPYFCPDVVTYLNYSENPKERNGILFCLREDREKSISDDKIQSIIQLIQQKNLSISYTTTVISEDISLLERHKVFEDKLNEFKKSKIVITDRLHGMLFAAITGTPCIAFDNLSGKVKGVYEWINYLEYIHIVSNINANISKDIDNLLGMENMKYDNKRLMNIFDNIINKLIN